MKALTNFYQSYLHGMVVHYNDLTDDEKKFYKKFGESLTNYPFDFKEVEKNSTAAIHIIDDVLKRNNVDLENPGFLYKGSPEYDNFKSQIEQLIADFQDAFKDGFRAGIIKKLKQQMNKDAIDIKYVEELVKKMTK